MRFISRVFMRVFLRRRVSPVTYSVLREAIPGRLDRRGGERL